MKIENNTFINKPLNPPTFGRYLGAKGSFYTEFLCAVHDSEARFLNRCKKQISKDLSENPIFNEAIKQYDIYLDLSCNKMKKRYYHNLQGGSWYALSLKIVAKPIKQEKLSVFKKLKNLLTAPNVLRYKGNAANILTADRFMHSKYKASIDNDLNKLLNK